MGEDVDPVGQTSHRLTVTVTDPISVPPSAVEVAREMHVRFELHSPTIDRIALDTSRQKSQTMPIRQRPDQHQDKPMALQPPIIIGSPPLTF
jgi:hypothetical protein